MGAVIWATCLASALAVKSTTNDYLQPYKFVKPLKDLEELYSKHRVREEEEKVEDEAVVPEAPVAPIAESRSGEAHPVVEDEETKPLMTSDLSAPKKVDDSESLPKALPMTDMRNRSRKRVSLEKKEEKDRISNHRTHKTEEEKLEEEEEKPAGPKAEPYKGRPSEQEYYDDDEYYYDDEYYDNLPEPTEKSKPRYQNIPPASLSKPKEYKPKPKPTSKYTKPKPSAYENHGYASKPKASSPKTKPKSYDSRPKSHDSKPKSYESRYKKPTSSKKPTSHKSYKSDYNIASTIKRLQDIKKSHSKRNGLPSLPNPWERFNMFSPPKTDSRKVAESRRSKPKPKPTKPYAEYYDDYYYDEPQSYKRQGYGAPAASGGANPLALLIAPLAGIALLTAAAAVAINPVLDTVSVTGKRRRRRDLDTVIGNNQGITPELEEKIHEMQVLVKFMSSVPENTNYQQQVLSMYLSCSGYTEMTNHCLDRVVCEYANNNNTVKQEERDVISIVLYNIMANEYVSNDYKDRLRVAARSGRDDGVCHAFECASLGDLDSNSL